MPPKTYKIRNYARIVSFLWILIFFYSREHEPIHVHVEGNDGYAKYELAGEKFVLKETQGIKAKDMKKIEFTIEENKDIIISRWKEYFKI
ncbi:MAG: DUF4160 domain-containing protein [Prevotella sp.]|nr:DUF4160 domain-containing protein [Prevotella sp.]